MVAPLVLVSWLIWPSFRFLLFCVLTQITIQQTIFLQFAVLDSDLIISFSLFHGKGSYILLIFFFRVYDLGRKLWKGKFLQNTFVRYLGLITGLFGLITVLFGTNSIPLVLGGRYVMLGTPTVKLTVNYICNALVVLLWVNLLATSTLF